MLLSHVAKRCMHERISQIRNPGEIKKDRLRVAPYAFHLEHPELIADVAIGEEIAEFGNHLELEFHGERLKS